MQQFADWGVDHLSVDNCGHPDGNSQSVLEYAKIYDALVKVGKPMVYGIWNIGAGKPQTCTFACPPPPSKTPPSCFLVGNHTRDVTIYLWATACPSMHTSP